MTQYARLLVRWLAVAAAVVFATILRAAPEAHNHYISSTIPGDDMPLCQMEGRMVDALSGQPIAGHPVSLQPTRESFARGPEYYDFTDADGRFSFDGFPEQEYKIGREAYHLAGSLAGVRAEARENPDGIGMYGPLQSVDYYEPPEVVPEKKNGHIYSFGEIRLHPIPKLKLKLFDAEGKPAAGVPLSIVGPVFWLPWRLGILETVNSDAEGKVEFPLLALKPGMPFAIVLSDYREDLQRIDLPGWDPLAEMEKAKGAGWFNANFPDESETLELIRHVATLPLYEHASVYEFPKGREIAIEYRLPPASAGSSLTLMVVDDATGEPIPEYSGYVFRPTLWAYTYLEGEYVFRYSADYDYIRKLNRGIPRIYSTDGTGIAIIPRIPANYPGAENGDPSTDETLYSIGLDAPGHTRVVYIMPRCEFPVDQPLKLRMTREAAVLGHVILPEGDLIDENGKSMPRIQLNDAITEPWDDSKRTRYKSVFAPSLDKSNSFEVHDLLPGTTWTLTVRMQGQIPITRSVVLHEGANDLGDIEFVKAGAMTGLATDEKHEPISGVQFCFPLHSILIAETIATTGDNGQYMIDMAQLETDHEIIRAIPPWGAAENDYEAPHIFYDTTMRIDRSSEQQFALTMDRGHVLTINMPVTPELLKLKADAEEHAAAARFQWDPVEYCLANVQIVGMSADEGVPVYHQEFNIEEGFLSGETATIIVPGVPPGRVAVSLRGALRENRGGEWVARNRCNVLAYVEIDMPAEDHVLAMTPFNSQLRIMIDGFEEGDPPSHGLATIERQGVMTTAFGIEVKDVRRRRWPIRIKSPTDFMMPFVGASTSFNSETDYSDYAAASISLLPPGKYTLSAYNEYRLPNDPPYHTETFEITDESPIEISIPKPPKSDFR